jgi:RNA polymerase sigma-70 factor, ECF subfamily
MRGRALYQQWRGLLDPNLEAAVSKHRPWLLAQARNICRNQADAEDLVQETLTRLVATFAEGTLPDEPRCISWLTTTLSNCFLSQCRRQRTATRASTDPHLTGEAVVAPPLGEMMRLYEQVTDEQFAEAVGSLSPRLRETFELYAKGKKLHEIAAILAIPIGTVGKRLHDARKKMRKHLLSFIRRGGH